MRMKAGMEAFAERRVEAIVHCGDVGSVACVEQLAAVGVPAYMVAGNMDHHLDRLDSAAAGCGVDFHWEVIEVPIGDGRHLAATHGHDEAVLAALIEGGQFPYVCHGHTHRPRDERIGHVRVINPGAIRHPCRGYRPTAAVLDTNADTFELFEVRRG